MTLAKGRNFLVEMDLEGTGEYKPVGCSRSDSIQFGLELLDVTGRAGSMWSTSINKGAKSLSASVEGFVSEGSLTTVNYSDLLVYFLTNDDPIPTRITSDLDGDGDPLHGNFFITSIQRTGPTKEAESFTINIQSSGAPSFTAPTPPEPEPDVTPTYEASITSYNYIGLYGFELVEEPILAVIPD